MAIWLWPFCSSNRSGGHCDEYFDADSLLSVMEEFSYGSPYIGSDGNGDRNKNIDGNENVMLPTAVPSGMPGYGHGYGHGDFGCRCTG